MLCFQCLPHAWEQVTLGLAVVSNTLGNEDGSGHTLSLQLLERTGLEGIGQHSDHQ